MLNLQQRYSRFFDEDYDKRERRLLLCSMNYHPGATSVTYAERGEAIAATVSNRIDDIVDVMEWGYNYRRNKNGVSTTLM